MSKSDLDGVYNWPQSNLQLGSGSERPAAHAQQKLTEVTPQGFMTSLCYNTFARHRERMLLDYKYIESQDSGLRWFYNSTLIVIGFKNLRNFLRLPEVKPKRSCQTLPTLLHETPH